MIGFENAGRVRSFNACREPVTTACTASHSVPLAISFMAHLAHAVGQPDVCDTRVIIARQQPRNISSRLRDTRSLTNLHRSNSRAGYVYLARQLPAIGMEREQYTLFLDLAELEKHQALVLFRRANLDIDLPGDASVGMELLELNCIKMHERS